MSASNGRPDKQSEVPAQPRSWLQPFLLLSLEEWQSHGYELIRRLSIFGFEAVDPGSVYRTLRQLERDGLVESNWDTETEGPARRRYAVTDSGRDVLEGWAGALRGYQHMLELFFNTYPGLEPDDGPATESHDRALTPAGKRTNTRAKDRTG